MPVVGANNWYCAYGEGFDEAGGAIEPLNWLHNTTPSSRRTGPGTVRYNSSQPWGSDPTSA
ncbi:MAG TPA: hypothetical protein VFT31_17540 [Kribbella sp.]|nr:hypothetical protein [Kribbella sp.]